MLFTFAFANVNAIPVAKFNVTASNGRTVTVNVVHKPRWEIPRSTSSHSVAKLSATDQLWEGEEKHVQSYFNKCYTKVSIVLYKIADVGVGPGIVHAAIRFKREQPEPFEFDAGWDRNGFYARVEERTPIHTIEITSVDGDMIFLMTDFIKGIGGGFYKKCYNMLENNCTDFVYGALMEMNSEEDGIVCQKELGMFDYN